MLPVYRYFENLAIETLDNLYQMNREEAYANLVSVIPFHWGQYTTPLSIANDGEAKRSIDFYFCKMCSDIFLMEPQYVRSINFYRFYHQI